MSSEVLLLENHKTKAKTRNKTLVPRGRQWVQDGEQDDREWSLYFEVSKGTKYGGRAA